MNSSNGYKKVGRKARSGRRKNPQGHGSHRSVGTPRDPITKAFRRIHKQKKLKLERRLEEMHDD